MPRFRRGLLACTLLVIASACGGGVVDADPSSTPTIAETTTTSGGAEMTSTTNLPSTTTSVVNVATTTTTEAPPVSTTAPQGNNVQIPDQLLQGVLADAAERAGIEPGSVVVISGEAVDWADGSLGCPQPGIDYIQVITPGYRVVVDAAGISLEYHLNQRGGFKQCTGGAFYPPSD